MPTTNPTIPATPSNTGSTANAFSQLDPRFTTQVQGSVPNLSTSKVDLTTIDPLYKPIYQAFNDSIDALGGQAANLVTQAQTSQQGANNDLVNNLNQIDQSRTSALNTNQQTGSDAQVANRERTRAIGGAPSSGFLELANKIDRNTQQGANSINSGAFNQSANARNTTLKAIADIQSGLNDALFKIQNDASLSLRERDSAVSAAVTKAQSDAINAALINGFAGNGTADASGAGGTGGAIDGSGDSLTVQPGQVEGISTSKAPATYNPNYGLSPTSGNINDLFQKGGLTNNFATGKSISGLNFQ